MSFGRLPRALLAAVVIALMVTSGAIADGENGRGIDPNQGDSLVEVVLPDKAAAIRLQLAAESYGIEFNEHYLRDNANGSVTATVFAADDELDALQGAGYELGTTIESPATWKARIAEREATIAAETAAKQAALGTVAAKSRRPTSASSRTRTRSSCCASTTSRPTADASSRSRRRPGSPPWRPTAPTPVRPCRSRSTAARAPTSIRRRA